MSDIRSLRYMKERQQIKDQKAHLADTVNGNRHELDVPDMLNDEDGAKLEQKRKRDQRGNDADHSIVQPQLGQQSCQKGIRNHQGNKILKSTFQNIRPARTLVWGRLKNLICHNKTPLLAG